MTNSPHPSEVEKIAAPKSGDLLMRLKSASLVAGAALLVVACDNAKPRDTNHEG